MWLHFLHFYPLTGIYGRLKQSFNHQKVRLINHIRSRQKRYCQCLLFAMIIVILEGLVHGAFVGFQIRDWLVPTHLLHAFAIGCLLAIVLYLHNSIPTSDLISSIVLILAVIVMLHIVIAGLDFSAPSPTATTPMVAAKLIGFQFTYQQLKAIMKGR